MTTIYLSSTYEDLKDYRHAVVEALRRSGYDVISMESYVAADQRPVDQCLEDVEAVDLYVGLFAFRYGYVPPSRHNNPDGLSITELELRHAENLKKPCLAFVVKDTTAWPRIYDDAYQSEDQGRRIKALRQWLLQEKLASEFSAPHELASLVLAAVAKHLARTTPQGPSAVTIANSLAGTWDIKTQGSPYPGLLRFRREHAPVFFGRDLEVREILDRMRSPEGRFLIISGDSGVGKSSIVDAGILPKLEAGGLPDNGPCDLIHMFPGKTQDPWSSLMAAGLGERATRAGLRPEEVVSDLLRDPEMFEGHLQRIVKDGTGHRSLLLFLDQMEELFTSQDAHQSSAFLTKLYEATQAKALWVIGTIRSDHLQYCHRHPHMLKVMKGHGHYPVGQVEPHMMMEMILKPAVCAGLNLSEAFARRLIADTGSDSANLPLLAFVLEQLFLKRTDHDVSEAVYKPLGGVGGAIASHVKTVEAKMGRELGVKADVVLPGIFHHLVNLVKEEAVPTRNRPPLTRFQGQTRKIVDVLVNERLLQTEGEGEAATVSISHEKLFEAWPALREYVDTHKKELADRTLFESRARKWANMGKPPFTGLASGREYKDFQRAGIAATGLMGDYLAASRRLRWLIHAAIGVVAMVVLLTTWLWQKGYSVEQAGLKIQSLFTSIHVPPEMQPVAGGTFRQGDIHGRGDSEEKPVHEVTVKPFAIGKFEVTFEEYDRFAIAAGRLLPGDQGWGRGRQPVINVSWQDAKEYAAWLSQETGKRFRLPTESEWEYAARSEGKNDIWAGTSEEEQLREYAVYQATSHNRTAPVGEKKHNGLGLHDLSGNVLEWVEDCVHGNYNEAPTDGSAWLDAGGGNCEGRVVRGGSWNFQPVDLRASGRYKLPAVLRFLYVGFRLVQDISE